MPMRSWQRPSAVVQRAFEVIWVVSSVAQTDLAGAVGGGAEDALLLLCRTILVDGDLGGDPRDERAEATARANAEDHEGLGARGVFVEALGGGAAGLRDHLGRERPAGSRGARVGDRAGVADGPTGRRDDDGPLAVHGAGGGSCVGACFGPWGAGG